MIVMTHRRIESLEFRNLTISFPRYPPTIKKINLKLYQGKTYLLTGPTASGKSILMRFIKGLIPLFYPATITGSILLNNKSLSIEEFWDYRGEIGYLFQDPLIQVIGSSVKQDLAFGLENQALSSPDMRDRIAEIGAMLNIEHLFMRSPNELSGGELALVALASILILRPQLLLLDEFTAFLDNSSRQKVFNHIQAIKRPNQITVIVSHHIQDVLPLVDEVIVIDEGRILLQALKSNFFTANYAVIEKTLRVPELFHVGVNLCKARGIVPDFDDINKLSHLLGGINSD